MRQLAALCASLFQSKIPRSRRADGGGGGAGMARKYLTRAAKRKALAHLQLQIETHREEWGVHGWGFVGRADAQRLELRVNERLLTPRVPIRPLTLSQGAKRSADTLRPTISASHAHLDSPSNFLRSQFAFPEFSVSEPLAPGSAIHIDSGLDGGVGCILRSKGEPYLLTCGHIVPPGADQNTNVNVEGHPVGALVKNYLPSFDAAVFELDDDGKQLLNQSKGAATFLRKVIAPADEQWQKDVEFYKSSGDSGAVTDKVACVSGTETGLEGPLWANLSFDHLIETSAISIEGDSGSMLSYSNGYYGLCTGAKGDRSLFTSIHLAIERIAADLQGVTIWTF